MKKWFLTLAFCLPLLAQTESEFRSIYDAYNRALRMKYYNALMAVLTEEQLKLYVVVPPEQREAFFGMTGRIPDSYEVEYLKLSPDGLQASMLIIGTFPASGGRERAEMTLHFARQKGFWRMDRPVYGDDPDHRPKPKDLNVGARSDYSDASINLLGTVLKVQKQDAGTVLVVKNGKEEDAVFIPKPQRVEGAVPGAVLTFHAAQHKSDKRKYWAESATLLE